MRATPPMCRSSHPRSGRPGTGNGTRQAAAPTRGADLRRGLAVLASVGSVAPFVGLLGTVLGIISAFQGIASTGSGGLSAVSSGISEALIETALGLAVAIPSVLGFNYLSTRVARDEAALNSAAGEVLDSVEGWAEEQLHEIESERKEPQRGRVA